MSTINRSVLVVKPREPFARWARSIFGEDDPDVGLERLREDVTAFLLPSFMDQGEEDAVIALHAEEIFEFVLWEWYTEPSAWPPVRDITVFKEWFDVETHCIVVDLGHDLLEHDEFEENG